MRPRITLICHLYYADSLEWMQVYLNNLSTYDCTYLFNINCASEFHEELGIQIRKLFPKAIFIKTPNIGKDIGGKLALIDLATHLGIKSDYYILVHDKYSLHTSTGIAWRNKLFRILEPTIIEKTLQLFVKSQGIGVIASKECIMIEEMEKENNENSQNRKILLDLGKKYSLTPSSHQFVGGTMFWVRTEIFNRFFSFHSPLSVRKTLEKGNVLDFENGSITHAWERLLSWIIFTQGYAIKGI